MNLERLALAAVAGNDGNVGLDSLERLKTELWVLSTALRNDEMPLDRRDAADLISQMIHRIELALGLAEADFNRQKAMGAE